MNPSRCLAVCPVVWEGRRREAPPYPDQSRLSRLVEILALPFPPPPLVLPRAMAESTPDSWSVLHGAVVPAPVDPPDRGVAAALSVDGQAAAAALARKAAAPATLRAYKPDWTHFASWCAAKDFSPVPAAPATVGVCLASLAESHAPTTVRRRLSELGKMIQRYAVEPGPS